MNFLIKAVGSNSDGIEPVPLMKIIIKLLMAFKVNFVYPFTAGVLIYGLITVCSVWCFFPRDSYSDS